MTSDFELMQKALDALRLCRKWEFGEDHHSDRETIFARALAAETLLEQRLAQPQVQPQPVAWRLRNTAFRTPTFRYYDLRKWAEYDAAEFSRSCDDGHLTDLTPLYLQPPQSAWQDLSDEQINAVLAPKFPMTDLELVRAVQAKLRQKNTQPAQVMNTEVADYAAA